MNNKKTVWSDELGDIRKKDQQKNISTVDEKGLLLSLRRLTSGKGRTVIEISSLPKNKEWCQQLAKDLKKKLGVGGTYKDNYIEIHGEQIDKVMMFLESRSIRWKKTGG